MPQGGCGYVAAYSFFGAVGSANTDWLMVSKATNFGCADVSMVAPTMYGKAITCYNQNWHREQDEKPLMWMVKDDGFPAFLLGENWWLSSGEGWFIKAFCNVLQHFSLVASWWWRCRGKDTFWPMRKKKHMDAGRPSLI
jgi:hypothetical protein